MLPSKPSRLDTRHKRRFGSLAVALIAALFWAHDADAARGGGGHGGGGGGGAGGGGGGHVSSGGGGGGGGRATFGGGGRSFAAPSTGRGSGISRAAPSRQERSGNHTMQNRRDHDGDRHRKRHYGRYISPLLVAPIYDSVTTYVDDDIDWDDCRALKRRAQRTDSKFWWRKYRECRDREDD